jgi:hypothetical protein
MSELTNPYQVLFSKLEEIENKVDGLKSPSAPAIQIVDRKQLQAILGVTEPTLITWGKRGRIPEMRIGSNVRYNLPDVVAALSH